MQHCTFCVILYCMLNILHDMQACSEDAMHNEPNFTEFCSVLALAIHCILCEIVLYTVQ